MTDTTEAAQPTESEPIPQFTFKKRSKNKGNFRKKPATPPPASDSDSDFASEDDGEGKRIKRRRTNGVVTASSTANKPRQDTTTNQSSSTGPTPLSKSNDATKATDWYEEENLTAKNLLGSTRTRPEPSSDSTPDGNYKGTSNYKSFIQKSVDAPKKFGPIKAATNVRTITVTDFAPDVCKDYKQTGYCGFGDSCKFLHAREDYKQGWELDRDWEIGTKGKSMGGRVTSQRKGAGMAAKDDDDDDDDEFLENIPFACVICRKPYQKPIVTTCGHYFCESCALQRYRKSPTCAICGGGTGGVFNSAKKLRALLEKKRERARKLREKAIAAGEEVSEEEEED
ncbi:Pre-mRNA-splicing factor cwc24 [Penicillium taxi]|uniref:Pre-mRNA-splicing factor cwc24 n=1 Tax=Penicillium taxi TaxID=168475 RepID=UPI002545B9C0|nr:Pre-mRNA-splicing factor cwc24 [Penicillium taxi]KAJ5908265.1 Pre-mRNA-splicing factor cwc24 [Penicillium taxi]